MFEPEEEKEDYTVHELYMVTYKLLYQNGYTFLCIVLYHVEEVVDIISLWLNYVIKQLIIN